MMRSNNFFPYFAAGSVFFIVLAIQILLGVFVYKDSKKRGMEPILWTLIVIFVPNLIGLIIYLVVRSSYKNNSVNNQMRCKKCGTLLQKNWKVCPNCMSTIEIDNTVKTKSSYDSNTSKTVKSSQTYTTNSRTKYDDFFDDGKSNNSTTTVIIIIVIIIALIAGLFMFKLIRTPRFFNMFPNINISIMNRESESSHHISKSFSYWDGIDEKEIIVKETGTLYIKYELICKEGSLYSALKDDANNLIETFPQNGKGVFEKEVVKGEIYYIVYRGEDAKGSLSFDCSVK